MNLRKTVLLTGFAGFTGLWAVMVASSARADEGDVCRYNHGGSVVSGNNGLDGGLNAARRCDPWKGVEPDKCDVKREFMPEPDPNEGAYAIQDKGGKAKVTGEAKSKDPRCPSGMQRVADFCMDQYLGSLVAVYDDESEGTWSPFHNPSRFKPQYNNSVDDCKFSGKFEPTQKGPYNACLWGDKYKGKKKLKGFRAVSIKGALPQADINRFEAASACEASGKRLCSKDEWLRACKGAGPTKRVFPYPEGGTKLADRVWGQCGDMPLGVPKSAYGKIKASPAKPTFYKPCMACHQNASSSECESCPDIWDIERKPTIDVDKHPPERFVKQFGDNRYSWGMMNACVAEVPRFADRNGAHPDCHTPDSDGGIYDLMGGKHEWDSETLPNGHGVFRGGYMDDTVLNGVGCDYATVAHTPDQVDESTGFRCCSDLK